MHHSRRGQLGWIALVVLILIGVVFVTPALRDWLLPWTKYRAEVQSAEGIIAQTYNPANAIYNYEWFKRQRQDILATETQIENTLAQRTEFLATYGDPATWPFNVQEEYARLSVTVTGQKNYYADLVAEYNARSQMVTREIFKDELPRHIDIRLWS